MNFRTKTLLFSFFLLAFANAFAQKTRVVTGVVRDTTGKAIEKATIRLFSSGSRDTLKTLSGDAGSFRFGAVPYTDFTISISSIGFATTEKRFQIEASKESFYAGVISMENEIKMMSEVVIGVPPIQVKEDTVEFKADSFKTKPGAVVEELLKKLPGVQVNRNGEVTAQGKKVTRVKVNGKDFFSGDPTAATRELPADIVDKVQVIDDYGDMANMTGIKDGEAEKVLNIELKKDKNKGFTGRASFGYGTDDRYEARLNANYFNNRSQISLIGNSNNINASQFNFGVGGGGGGNLSQMGRTMGVDQGTMNSIAGAVGGDFAFASNAAANQDGITTNHSIGLNFRQDFDKSKGAIYGSYSYANRTTDGFRDISQKNYFETGYFQNDRYSEFKNLNQNHRVNLNLEYKLDSFTNLRFRSNFAFSDADNKSIGDFQYYKDEQLIKTSEGINADSTDRTNPNTNGNLVINRRFHKRGRSISMELNYSLGATESEQDKYNRTTSFPSGGNPVTFRQDQVIIQDNNNNSFGIRATYTEPIRADMFLDLSYSYSRSYNKNDKGTFSKDILSGDTSFMPNLSNAYENTFINQQMRVSMRQIKKKYNYSLGAIIQPVELRGYSITKDSNYIPANRLTVLPVARFTYNFSRTRNLNINYNGNAQQPSLTQLQPVLDISNPQYQTIGNPDLKPAINHSINLTFNNFNFVTGKTLFTGFSSRVIQNRIVNNVVPIGTNGAQLSKPDNINGYYNVSAFYVFTKPYQNRRYVPTLNGSITYNHDVGLLKGEKNIGHNYIASQGASLEFNYKDIIEWRNGVLFNINSTKYTLSNLGRQTYTSWVISSDLKVYLPWSIILTSEFDYTINDGLSGSVNQNFILWNAVAEKNIFKKQNGTIKLTAFDILKQNLGIERTINGNSIVDTRTNRLEQYFMLTFQYRFSKFSGGTAPQGAQRMMRMME